MAKKTYTLKVGDAHAYYAYDDDKTERLSVSACTPKEEIDGEDYVYKEPEDQLSIYFSGLAKNWPFDELGDTITITLGS